MAGGKSLTPMRFARTAASGETNTQRQGRGGDAATMKKPGPVLRGGVAKNPTARGGINRSVKSS